MRIKLKKIKFQTWKNNTFEIVIANKRCTAVAGVIEELMRFRCEFPTDRKSVVVVRFIPKPPRGF